MAKKTESKNPIRRLTITQTGTDLLPKEVRLDGKKLDGVYSVDFHCDATSVPQVTISINSSFETDLDVFPIVEFTPLTIEQAIGIFLRNAEGTTLRLDMTKYGVYVYLNDVRVPRVNRVDTYIDGKPLSVFEDRTKFLFSYLREMLIWDEDLYNAFVASIDSAIDDCADADLLSECIADRIIGKK